MIQSKLKLYLQYKEVQSYICIDSKIVCMTISRSGVTMQTLIAVDV